MRLRGPARLLAVALFASLLSPVMLRPSPALAAVSCSTTGDSSAGDYNPSAWSDGESTKLRIVRPANGGTGDCAKPSAGWPLIVYMHGYTSDRCENMSFASRATMASWGYAVLSFNGRGGPAPGASACNALADAQDTLDDDGRDYTGPRDRLDVNQLIDWVRDNYAPTGCTTNCVDTNKVGLTGFSYGGMRSLVAGIGSPTNPQFDSRVDAVAPVAGGINWDNVAALSSDGAATPVWRPRSITASPVWWGHSGWMTHTHESVMTNFMTAERAGYLNQAIPSVNTNGSMTNGSAVLTISGSPSFSSSDVGSRINVAGAATSGATLYSSISTYTSATQVTLATAASTTVSAKRVAWGARGYSDERSVLDDDPILDKASKISVPILLVNGWLDGTIGSAYSEVYGEFYNKISGNNRYLYLGSCTHYNGVYDGDPCHQTTNGPRMRDTLYRFFNRYVKGNTACGNDCNVRPPGTTTCNAGGPCVIYTVPTKWVSSTNNAWYTDNWGETAVTTWPPSSATTETRYLRNAGTLTTTSESGTTCTPGTPPAKGTGCSTFYNDLNYPWATNFCYGITYGTTEVQSYDWSFTADKKVARLEADLYLSSNTTRQQVYVDLYLTNSSGTELTRISQGSTQIAPVKRGGTANTVYRFKFRPGTGAWTVANGQKLRVKVASKYANGMPAEPLYSTYTLYHNDTYKSSIKLTYVS